MSSLVGHRLYRIRSLIFLYFCQSVDFILSESLLGPRRRLLVELRFLFFFLRETSIGPLSLEGWFRGPHSDLALSELLLCEYLLWISTPLTLFKQCLWLNNLTILVKRINWVCEFTNFTSPFLIWRRHSSHSFWFWDSLSEIGISVYCIVIDYVISWVHDSNCPS